MQTSIHRRQFVQSLVAGSAALAGSQVWASDFPSRPIRQHQNNSPDNFSIHKETTRCPPTTTPSSCRAAKR